MINYAIIAYVKSDWFGRVLLNCRIWECFLILGSGCATPLYPWDTFAILLGKNQNTGQKAARVRSGWLTHLWDRGLSNSVYRSWCKHMEKTWFNGGSLMYCITGHWRLWNMKRGWQRWDLALRKCCGDLINVYKYLMGGNKEGRTRLFSKASNGKTS